MNVKGLIRFGSVLFLNPSGFVQYPSHPRSAEFTEICFVILSES